MKRLLHVDTAPMIAIRVIAVAAARPPAGEAPAAPVGC